MITYKINGASVSASEFAKAHGGIVPATNKQVLGEGIKISLSDMQSTASHDLVDTYVSVDTVRLVRGFDSPADYHAASDKLKGLADNGHGVVPAHKYAARYGFERAYKVLGVGSDAALIFTGRAAKTANYGRCVAVQAHLSKVPGGSLSALAPCFQHFYFGGLTAFLSKARITEIDLAIDVVGVALHELMISHPTTHLWGKVGTTKAGVQTITFGSPSSKESWRVYDRAAKQAKAHYKLPYGSNKVVRFEKRLKGPFTLQSLMGMYNPIGDLKVGRIESLPSVDPINAELLKVMFHLGGYPDFNAALKSWPMLAKLIHLHLKSLSAAWWKPHALWSGYKPYIPTALGIMLEAA